MTFCPFWTGKGNVIELVKKCSFLNKLSGLWDFIPPIIAQQGTLKQQLVGTWTPVTVTPP